MRKKDSSLNNTVYGEERKHAQEPYEVLCVSIVIYSIRSEKIGYTVTNMCSSGSKNQGIFNGRSL